MYGHQIFRLTAGNRAELINRELRKAEYQDQELHQLVDSLMIAEDDLKSDLAMYGWYYIAELKCFVQIKTEHASLSSVKRSDFLTNIIGY
ncbi:hypothetical protein D3P08_00210 [Paenibacillus nanensis]|uniref:Uncharacterized protein n=1 Tax=Paenibacillus nanensis TaxID=393251 RepID=A0A3A1VNF4_9BACL|nr:hypothetical protein [Paenibacillus nanensis]RIX60053.1 hypothetical protein D3P08_00210 [Paenibacillus nanensis]